MQTRLTTLLLLPTLVLIGACAGPESPNEPPDERAIAATPGFRFTDVSATSGIDLLNVSGDPAEKMAIPESLGQGAAAIDYDGDGLLDLFVANGDRFGGGAATPRSALYRNLGGLRFEDVSQAAGVALAAWSHGATCVDFDGDGRPDLYVTTSDGPNRFLRNRGDGTFEDATLRWGGGDPGPSTAAAFFDADGDGDLDLYVGNYVHYDPARPPNDGQPCEWRGLRVFCGPQGTTPAADAFYENRDGVLTEATAEFGFEAAPSYTLGAVTGDFDNDGDVDLYVANDSEPNYLFQGTAGRFREVAATYGVDSNQDGRDQAGMGVDFADVDNDGHFDLFVTNFSHDTNTLYHQFATPSGGTMFEDATYMMNLGLGSHPYLSWGTRILDVDRDGWQDVVVVSGHVYPQVDRAPVGTTYGQRNQIFRNTGPGARGHVSFEQVVAATGDAFEKQAVSRGLVAADLDNDGDTDFLVTEMDAPPTLIRHDGAAGHWIGFELSGPPPNRDAIGARIEVEDSSGTIRWRERTSGGSYLSSGDPRLTIGLGTAGDTIRRVTLRWPSGDVDEHRDLDVDRYWRLEAETGAASLATAPSPR